MKGAMFSQAWVLHLHNLTNHSSSLFSFLRLGPTLLTRLTLNYRTRVILLPQSSQPAFTPDNYKRFQDDHLWRQNWPQEILTHLPIQEIA